MVSHHPGFLWHHLCSCIFFYPASKLEAIKIWAHAFSLPIHTHALNFHSFTLLRAPAPIWHIPLDNSKYSCSMWPKQNSGTPNSPKYGPLPGFHVSEKAPFFQLTVSARDQEVTSMHFEITISLTTFFLTKSCWFPISLHFSLSPSCPVPSPGGHSSLLDHGRSLLTGCFHTLSFPNPFSTWQPDMVWSWWFTPCYNSSCSLPAFLGYRHEQYNTAAISYMWPFKFELIKMKWKQKFSSSVILAKF